MESFCRSCLWAHFDNETLTDLRISFAFSFFYDLWCGPSTRFAPILYLAFILSLFWERRALKKNGTACIIRSKSILFGYWLPRSLMAWRPSFMDETLLGEPWRQVGGVSFGQTRSWMSPKRGCRNRSCFKRFQHVLANLLAHVLMPPFRSYRACHLALFIGPLVTLRLDCGSDNRGTLSQKRIRAPPHCADAIGRNY